MKYKLTNECIKFDGVVLYRIQAVKRFGLVKEGDLGGFVQSEDNLSQKQNCWIGDNAKVYGDAKIFNDALVLENAVVCDNVRIWNNAEIRDNTIIFGTAKIHGYALVEGDSVVGGDTKITKRIEEVRPHKEKSKIVSHIETFSEAYDL